LMNAAIPIASPTTIRTVIVIFRSTSVLSRSWCRHFRAWAARGFWPSAP
jgi:hypothetical protein